MRERESSTSSFQHIFVLFHAFIGIFTSLNDFLLRKLDLILQLSPPFPSVLTRDLIFKFFSILCSFLIETSSSNFPGSILRMGIEVQNVV